MVRIKPAESVRRMPDLWEPNYAFMLKTQKGIAYYFHTQGRPVKCRHFFGQASAHLPHRMHSGEREISCKDSAAGQALSQAPQETQFPWSH